MSRSLLLATPPAIEPVSLLELKSHLRIDSGTLADNLSPLQSIRPGAHVMAPAFGLLGEDVAVAGYSVLVIMEAGTFVAGRTATVKLQDSLDGIAWTDVVGGAFAAVTVANDEQTFELAYTGLKTHLRAVATVEVGDCEFGVSMIRSAPTSIEDTLLSALIVAARDYAEGFQGRAYITQTWELALDEWPDIIPLPKPPLQSVDSIEYYDTAGALNLLAPADYQVDVRGYQPRISPVYGGTWPSIQLQPLAGIVVTFTAGYGDLASDVPDRIRTAIEMLAGHLYEHREATDIKEVREVAFAVHALLGLDRVYA
jgi:uncharacterized phiE125 gp8 family phage protein